MDAELHYPYEGGGASLDRPMPCPAFSPEKLAELREEVRRVCGELVFPSPEAEQDFLRAWDTQMRVHHMEDDE